MEKKFLYQKVYEDVREKIEQSFYAEGEKLPEDEALCEGYQVSRITLNKSLRMLAEQGYVKRVPGKGTYICKRMGEKRQIRSRLIGAVLEHVSTPFGLEMMYYLDQFAGKAGYKLVLRFSYGNREKETEEIKFLISLGAEGILVMPSHGKHYSQEILRLCLSGFPVVLVDKKLNGIPVASVRTDNKEAVAVLVKELLQMGCRKIAFIATDDREADSVRERRNGYISEIEKYGLEEAGICVVPTCIGKKTYMNNDFGPEITYEVCKFLEQNREDVDGIIAAEYSIVPAILQAMEQAGLKEGKDIYLTCIDEDCLAPWGTTFMHVKQDEKGIAQKAMELLLRKLEGKHVEGDFLISGRFCAPRRKASGAQNDSADR